MKLRKILEDFLHEILESISINEDGELDLPDEDEQNEWVDEYLDIVKNTIID
jgi:hypothetical protein